MFKHDSYTAHLFGMGGPRRIVITDKNIVQAKDLTLYYSEEPIKNEQSYIEAMNKNWGWLKIKDNILKEEVLDRMRFWQNKPKTKKWIFLCNPAIIKALCDMGIRNEFPNWQVPNTKELDDRLTELYGNKYNSESGVLSI